MYKQLLLLFVFYLAGVAVSPLLASEEWNAEKSQFYSFGEDSLERLEDFGKLPHKLPEFNGFSYANLVLPQHGTLVFSKVKNLQATQDSRMASCPLYLLYHSFLFYELS